MSSLQALTNLEASNTEELRIGFFSSNCRLFAGNTYIDCVPKKKGRERRRMLIEDVTE